MSQLETPIPWPRFVAQNSGVWASPSTPEWLHRNRDANGLARSGALVKTGGRWYVIESRFWRWFTRQSRTAA